MTAFGRTQKEPNRLLQFPLLTKRTVAMRQNERLSI